MQKVQNTTTGGEMTHSFLFYAFSVTFLLSAGGFFIRGDDCKPQKEYLLRSSAAGICFGGANYLNTVLAGKMVSSVFFPSQNIGTLILSTVLSMLLFKEKIGFKKAVGLFLGIAAIITLKITL